jgi:hypothetical protein
LVSIRIATADRDGVEKLDGEVTKLLQNKKEKVIGILAIIYAWIVCWTGTPVSDDIWFRDWKFDTIWDMFLLHPNNITIDAAVPHNGRYLGNILGLMMSKTYGTWIGIGIRTILITGSVILIYLFICRICKVCGNGKILLIFFLVLSPIHFYREVFHWGAGFSNYVSPIIGTLVMMNCLLHPQKNKRSNILIFLVAFCSQLFVEHMTVFHLIMIGAYGGYVKVIQHKKIPVQWYIVLLGVIFGAIAMFAYTGYWTMSDQNYRSIGIDQIWSAAKILSYDSVVGNGILWLLAAVCLPRLTYRKDNMCRWARGLFDLCVLYSLVRVWTVTTGAASYRRMDIVVAICMVLLLGILISQLQKTVFFWMSLAWILSLIGINGMLLVVSPIGARCAYVTYIATIIWTICLYQEVEIKKLTGIRGLTVGIGVCALAVAFYLSYHYVVNYHVEVQLEKYMQEEMEKKSTAVYLPAYPYPDFVYEGEQVIYYMYDYYYEKPGDIYIELKPYEDWKIYISQSED